MTYPLHSLPASSRRVLFFGQALIVLGLCLFAGSLIAVFVQIIGSGPEPHFIDDAIRSEFIGDTYDGVFSKTMRFLTIPFMLLGSISGILALVLAFRLFQAYKRGEVFTPRTAWLLNHIGWLIAALAPLSMLTYTVAVAVYSWWIEPGDLTVHIKLEEGDIYALVFGLLIVIVSHVMRQAIAINEENKGFV